VLGMLTVIEILHDMLRGGARRGGSACELILALMGAVRFDRFESVCAWVHANQLTLTYLYPPPAHVPYTQSVNTDGLD
jgi:hypothetical protein